MPYGYCDGVKSFQSEISYSFFICIDRYNLEIFIILYVMSLNEREVGNDLDLL